MFTGYIPGSYQFAIAKESPGPGVQMTVTETSCLFLLL